MKERQILFSAPMVRALLAGTKTQTRRLVKLPHQNPLGAWEPQTIGGPNGGRLASGETIPEQGAIWHTRTGDSLCCPKGQPGDRLWVREAWQSHIGPMGESIIYAYRATDDARLGPWRPSIHMPRAASRITLEITGVRVERLQDISIEDAKAEGAWPDVSVVGDCAAYFGIDVLAVNPVRAFQMLWERINGADAWNANPWVWVLEFKLVGA